MNKSVILKELHFIIGVFPIKRQAGFSLGILSAFAASEV